MVDLFVVCERCACAHGGKEEKINRHYIGFVVCVFFSNLLLLFVNTILNGMCASVAAAVAEVSACLCG